MFGTLEAENMDISNQMEASSHPLESSNQSLPEASSPHLEIANHPFDTPSISYESLRRSSQDHSDQPQDASSRNSLSFTLQSGQLEISSDTSRLAPLHPANQTMTGALDKYLGGVQDQTMTGALDKYLIHQSPCQETNSSWANLSSLGCGPLDEVLSDLQPPSDGSRPSLNIHTGTLLDTSIDDISLSLSDGGQVRNDGKEMIPETRLMMPDILMPDTRQSKHSGHLSMSEMSDVSIESHQKVQTSVIFQDRSVTERDFSNSTTEYRDLGKKPSQFNKSSNSNASSSSASFKTSESFNSQQSSMEEIGSEEDLKETTDTPEAMNTMMLEVGSLDQSDLDYRTALTNREVVISRLSTSLQHVLQERREDGEMTDKLEDEVSSLKEQVRLALEKVTKNKNFKVLYHQMKNDNEKLEEQLRTATAKLDENVDMMVGKEAEIVTLEKSNQNLLQMEMSLKETVEKSQQEIKAVKLLPAAELLTIQDGHNQEVKEMEDQHEEERVVEMNLLDMEIERLRDERSELLERLSGFDKNTEEDTKVVETLQAQQDLLVSRLTKEKNEVLTRLTELEALYQEEVSHRQSLETDLAGLGSMLDDTQYQFLPRRVRESIESSLGGRERMSIEMGDLSLSRRESFQLMFSQTSASVVTPPNITQEVTDTFELQINDSDSTPTHKPRDEVASLRKEHEREMSELRKYFESVCQEQEARYRAEIEEHNKRSIPTPGWMGVTPTTSGPIGLEQLGSGQLEFEFESMSPRSGFSSDNNTTGRLSRSRGGSAVNSRENSDLGLSRSRGGSAAHSRENSDLDTSDASRTVNSNRVSENLANLREQHEAEEIARLTSVIEDLRGQLESMRAEKEQLKINGSKPQKETHDHEISIEDINVQLKQLEENHAAEIDSLKDTIKKELEAEHMKKFTAVSKQIQQLHNSELESMRARLIADHADEKNDLQEKMNSLQEAFSDLKEAHQLEMKELERKFSQEYKSPQRKKEKVTRGRQGSPSTAYLAMEEDLACLEEERDQLRSMQVLMRDLITELALHYDLSEHQVRLLSESRILLDSFNCDTTRLAGLLSRRQSALLVTPVGSPAKQLPPCKEKAEDIQEDVEQGPLDQTDLKTAKSLLTMEELSSILGPGKVDSPRVEQVLKELQEKVRQANTSLLDQANGGSLASTPRLGIVAGELDRANFVGEEAGRLEIEKARLEVELAAAQQRVQELEMSSRVSLGRSDLVISGCGELGGSLGVVGGQLGGGLMQLVEVRERAARLLALWQEDTTQPSDPEEVVTVLGELLVHSDNISLQAKEQVEDVTGQLEVADKQLRSTRAFLEEQALEREAEREEWERRLKAANRSRAVVERRESSSGEAEEVAESGEGAKVGREEVEKELTAAVDKIYELRDIIRSLETQLELKTRLDAEQQEMVSDLRLALEEAMIGQTLVQQELETLRSSSSDQEVVEHIRGLEEQLASKTQELRKQRAAVSHIQEIKVQLRGLEERVELNTRELEHSVADHLSTTTSGSSSRTSTSPMPPMGHPASRHLRDSGSFDDIGSNLSGLEVEEVSRLEKKLKYLEKAEKAAVERVKKLEAEKELMGQRLKETEEKFKSLELSSASKEESIRKLQEIEKSFVEKVRCLTGNVEEAKLKLKKNEKLVENLEDIEAERQLLQQKVTEQQIQISSLQSSVQATRHRSASGSGDVQKLIQEKELIRGELEELKLHCKTAEEEKVEADKKIQQLLDKISALEESALKTADPESSNEGGSCANCAKLSADKVELMEVQDKLQAQLTLARAAQLLAQKTEMPLLAQKLLDEKNQELDNLKAQLSGSLMSQAKHSTPNSLPWVSRLEETGSNSSVEQLRDASHLTRELRASDLSLENIQRLAVSSGKTASSSGHKLHTIQESDPVAEHPVKNTVSKKLSLDDGSLEASVVNGHLIEETNAETGMIEEGNLTEPKPDSTEELEETTGDQGDVEDIINAKVAEIEYMTKLLYEKESTIDNLQDNLDDVNVELRELKAAVDLEMKEKQNLDNLLEEEKDKNIMLTNLLQETERQVHSLENKSFSNSDAQLVHEIKVLREEKEDMRAGMENLHQIIEANQSELELRRYELENSVKEVEMANENMVHLKNDLTKSKETIEQLQLNLEAKLSLEIELRESHKVVSMKEQAIVSLQLQVESYDKEKKNHVEKETLDKVYKEKDALEKQLEKITLEMASVEKVVTEMTSSFKGQIRSKEEEIQQISASYRSISSLNSDLEKRCRELSEIHKENKEKINQLEKELSDKSNQVREENRVTHGSLEELNPVTHGSLDELSNLVQAELDLSTELDNSLLSQVVGGLNSSVLSTSSSGLNEVQRIMKKVQVDGSKILSLSERLFLIKHANVTQNISATDDNSKNSEDAEARERELGRKLEVLEFRLSQEKVQREDLRAALDQEKRAGLEQLSRLGREQRGRSELEVRLGEVQAELRKKENTLHFNSDSENEEFLNTIEAQKVQIISLEESLKVERENFGQLQHVLEVERNRGRREDGARLEEVASRLRTDLSKERGTRARLEDSLQQETDDVGRMIIRQLQGDLEYERERLVGLEGTLEKERQKYFDIYSEYEHLKKVGGGNEGEGKRVVVGQDSVTELERHLRSKNLELERYSAELELKLEMLERDMVKLRQELVRVEGDLVEERDRNMQGLNKEQVGRMRQLNTFLEHNLRENGEMLQSLAKLHEEKQVMKAQNWELKDRLRECVCLGSLASNLEPGNKSLYGKYLRAESFRKALVWQKRYLLVLLNGEMVPEPVMVVVRNSPSSLGRNGRFRAVVHLIVSISRMKYLVKRWRSGKRAGARSTTTSRAWSQASGGTLSLTTNSPASLVSPRTDDFLKSKSVPDYVVSKSVAVHNSVSSETSPASPRDMTYQSKNPPTFGRSQSFRSTMPRPTTSSTIARPTTLPGVPPPASPSSSSVRSNGSSLALAVTGRTPPTRDVTTSRLRSSLPAAVAATRRNLGSQFKGGREDTRVDRNDTISGVQDRSLQRDLQDYVQRFEKLTKKS